MKLSGYKADEIIGRSSRHLFKNEAEFDRVDKLRSAQLKKSDTSAFETRFVCKNGNFFEAYFTSAYIDHNEPEKGYIVTVTDISKLKKAEAERASLQAQLLEARKVETITTLAGGVAHDFNNALTCVIGNIELLKMGPTSSEAIECADAVEESAYRMADLTKKLLAYARGGKYQAQELDLQNFLKRALSEVAATTRDTIELVSNFNCPDTYIKAAPEQLQMVFDAIVTNAVEAIEEKGRIEISCEPGKTRKDLTVESPDDDFYACIRVKDSGQGMDKAVKERVFEPFFTTKFAGRGLGMAAAYGIVTNHDGHIFIDSKPNFGTTIEVYLPQKNHAATKTPEKPVKNTILVVEDEENLQLVEKRFLIKLGYRVLTANNGKEALQVVKKFAETIDIAIVDVVLPDISGDILSSDILNLCPTIKIVLCSASVPGWLTEKALAGGAKGFIKKPFNLNELKNILTKTIDME